MKKYLVIIILTLLMCLMLILIKLEIDKKEINITSNVIWIINNSTSEPEILIASTIYSDNSIFLNCTNILKTTRNDNIFIIKSRELCRLVHFPS